jgi:hypothetical protein
LYIRGGTYVEGINANNQTVPTGTSWTNPVTIASFPGETAILRPNDRQEIVNFAIGTLQYIVFDRIVLDGTNLTGAPYDDTSHNWGLAINGDAHHIRFQNGEIRNVNGINVALYGGTGGAYPAHIEILRSKIYGANSHAFYVNTANNLFEGNEIYNNAGYAIQLYNGDTRAGVSQNIVRNNRIYGNDLIRQWGGAITMGHGSNNQVYNNLIYGNNGGIEFYAGGSNHAIYNNTIYNNPNTPAISVSSGYGGGAIVRNNIFYQNGGGISNPNGLSLTASNNLTTNPIFANASTADFHLTAASVDAINKGTTVSSVTTDFDGVSRPQGTAYDIGAY